MLTATEDRVRISTQRLVTFAYDLTDAEPYRHLRNGCWLPESIWRQRVALDAGDSDGERITPEEIADNVLDQLFRQQGLVRSCDDPEGPYLTLDRDACDYVSRCVLAVIEALVTTLCHGEMIQSDGEPPCSTWESGYTVPPFLVPAAVSAVFRRRGVHRKGR